MTRRRWFDLHRWVGLKLSILMSVILISGTLAVVSHEIDWLIDPSLRVAPQPAENRVSWGVMLAAVETAYPDDTVQSLTAPIDPWFAAEALTIRPNGQARRVRVNPYTGAVQGEAGWTNAQRILRDTHRRLMIPTGLGVIAVSLFSLLLLGSMISGLVVYRKFWRGFFRVPRDRDARTLWGDLHRLGGLWGLWFIAIIGLTGLFYLLEATAWRAAPFTFEERAQPIDRAALSPQAEPQPLDAMIAAAQTAAPGFRVQVVYPPKTAAEPLKLQGQRDAILVRDRANEVRVDPFSGDVLAVLDATTLAPYQRISEAADPLHFGYFGGFATKLLYLVFGVILSGMSLSGVYVYSARIRRNGPVRDRAAPPFFEPGPAE
ncbi:MAG: PepSY-associated TM helix domain-containing protein [Maricaulaceae bacterium]